MSSINSRLKNFGFGKRKSTASIQTVDGVPPSHTGTPPPGQIPQSNLAGLAPLTSSTSTTSLPMNHPGAGNRPPSYTANYPQNPAAQPLGRTSPLTNQGPNRTPPSQMVGGPPPINTGAPVGYPPNMAQGMGGGPPMGHGGPPQGYPPPAGYPPGPPPQPSGPMAQQQFGQNRAEVEGSSQSKAQLIVGIDFGTTFSGVAFAFATNNEAKEDIITEWPGAGSYTKQKIPTVLYYDQYQKVVGWGPDIADALAPTGYPKPGVQKVEWFKLQLMLSGNTYIDPINLPPLPPGKSEIDVAADYLFKLRQAMRAALQKALGEVFNREERNIRYYLTVPAIWNDAGKAATRAAAIQAGFLRDENDNRLTLVSEPEAAALFCSKTGLLNLRVHDAVLIVDCGGGTVDLIAYEVEEENPFTVAECTAGSGDSCGSTALNRNFSNILRTKIRKMKLPEGSKTAGRVYAKCIMDFENRIKADFRNNGQKWAVDVGIEAEFPEAGIEEGYMTFTNEEILQCFEPVVNRILELVRNQIIAIQAQNRTLQNILVVGGFGASEYLFQQIKLHVPPQFQSKVVRPMDSVAAIVKGAVTAGISERIITHRIARRHYLMGTLQPFKEGYHPEAYRVPSLDGKDRCKFTRQIFVQRGQKVKNGETVKVSFFRQVAPGATLMYEDVLYACDDDVCPEYTKDPRIKEVVTLTSDLSRKNLEKDFERMDTPQGTFYRVYFDIYLTLDGSEFSTELVCQGEVMGRCRYSSNLSICASDGDKLATVEAMLGALLPRQRPDMNGISRRRDCFTSTSNRLLLGFGILLSLLQCISASTNHSFLENWQAKFIEQTSPRDTVKRGSLGAGDDKVPLVITNRCDMTIWPGTATQGGLGPGTGGFELQPGESKNLTVGSNWQGRIWGRTNCTVNGESCACQTGDCFAKLDCQFSSAVPATLVEFNLAGGVNGMQTFYDISLVDGYNLPVGIEHIPSENTSFVPPNLTNSACVATAGWLYDVAQPATYSSNETFPIPLEKNETNDMLSKWCPWRNLAFPPQKPSDGIYPYPDDNIQRPSFSPCKSACATTGSDSDCCIGKYHDPTLCKPSIYSKNVKAVCPDAYSFAFDDRSSTFIVPKGGGWRIVWCPAGRSTDILNQLAAQMYELASGGKLSELSMRRLGNVSFVNSRKQSINEESAGERVYYPLVLLLAATGLVLVMT
ncbi:Heat shock Hsp70 [Cordyceps militaris]|uniref:Heat shock Hsp70 n=1 Tax=Cordyceps militaris TaxID=73501 RepID=A0A2H4SBA3_CORMI|nr:Heat shock Hsp70 [Cordyceps militaris]